MKKNYIFLLLMAFFSIGFSQSPIVTIDRPNVIGPTNTGNDPSINSSGMVRGAGVSISVPTATNFSTKQWNATSQTDAALNNEFIEWSVTANGFNSVEITSINIRSRISTDGPANWQIFYSLDNFATAGIAATVVQNSTTSATVSTFSGLNIISGSGGTVTFRLYAWNAGTDSGWFRIPGQVAWSGFGISLPGIRLSGTITETAPNSIESDIIATSFDPVDNIDYTSYTASSGLTTANAIKVGEFAIRDGGADLTDIDAVGTILTDLEFSISNFLNLEAIAVFDGSTNIGEASVSSDMVSINNLNSGLGITSADDATRVFDVYATFKSSVVDNEQFQLSIAAASSDPVFGSSFPDFDAGGAQTPITGDDNRIEVTANEIVFDQQPTDTYQFEVMRPFPTVIAIDGNGNQDLDYNDSISVISSGSLDPSPIIYSMTNGIAIFDSIVFTEKEVVTTIVAFGAFFAASDSFVVDGPLIPVAIQDFDGSNPDWTYSTDVATFDNGWGTDGYYGIIDSAIAAPLDNQFFSGNIFGEYDLNDEGDNGTIGFATITFDPIDISDLDNIRLTFDWDIHGYTGNDNDARYRLIYDGMPQSYVFLLDGNGDIDTDQGRVSVDIPDGVSTVALQVSIRNNGNGFSGFDNFELSSVFDGLLYVDNGWTPNAPSPTTGSEDVYVFNGTYNVAENIQANNFYINEGATTSVTEAQSITLNGGLVNSGTLELNSVSTTYSSLITDEAQGEVTYNRFVNPFQSTPDAPTGQNDLISAPVTNSDQTFLAFRNNNPDLPSGTIGGVPSFLFGPFDNDANEYINYNASNDLSILETGIGYRTGSIVPSGSLFTFTGDVETGSVSVPITVGSGSIFNLVGNPYPSYINLSSFLAANTSEFDPLSSGVYGYDGSASDGYAVWNQAYSDANPNAKITPGQGFLVASASGGGTITFTPEMRSIGTGDDFIAGRNANSSPVNAFLNLKISNSESTYKTDLYFNENASLGMDVGYDSEIYNSETPNFALYSHLVEDNTGVNMAVQSVDYNALDNVTIPLGVHAYQGEEITFSISNDNIPTDVFIYLEDNVNNTFTDLRLTDYSIIPNTALTGTGRFSVHFSRQQLNVSEEVLNSLQIYTTVAPKQFVIKGQIESSTRLQIIDIQGRVMFATQLNPQNTTYSIEATNFASGVYIVQLENDNTSRTQKVMLR